MKALSQLMALTLAGSFAVVAPLTAVAQVTAKFAVTLPEKSHQGQGVAKFIELVDAKSGGKIKIKGFYAGALGNDVQVTSALQGGTIEFTVPQTTTLTGMVRSTKSSTSRSCLPMCSRPRRYSMARWATSSWPCCPRRA